MLIHFWASRKVKGDRRDGRKIRAGVFFSRSTDEVSPSLGGLKDFDLALPVCESFATVLFQKSHQQGFAISSATAKKVNLFGRWILTQGFRKGQDLFVSISK
jgi:hypothetical protein